MVVGVDFSEFPRKFMGQEFAVLQVATVVLLQRDATDNRVFLFVGPTGVGKTALARRLAEAKKGLFGP